MVWLIVNIVTGKEYHRLNKPLVKNWFCMVKLNWKKVCFLCLMKTTESFKGFTDITQLHPEATVAILLQYIAHLQCLKQSLCIQTILPISCLENVTDTEYLS